jgi:hypothetical protein
MALILPVCAAAGCGGGDAKARNDVAEVGMAYHTFYDQQKKGPKDATELAVQLKEPVAKLLREGQIVIIPSVDLKEYHGKTDIVVAYDKDVSTKGGYVAMTDGSVQKMTAEQFGKATKATPKQ